MNSSLQDVDNQIVIIENLKKSILEAHEKYQFMLLNFRSCINLNLLLIIVSI